MYKLYKNMMNIERKKERMPTGEKGRMPTGEKEKMPAAK